MNEDINRSVVLKEFIDRKKILWENASNIFGNIVNGKPRADLLGEIIEQLRKELIVERVSHPFGWQVIDIKKAKLLIWKNEII